jgi:hypothetical protein
LASEHAIADGRESDDGELRPSHVGQINWMGKFVWLPQV